ncbi:hypothetical protein [Polynucleobacter rarus]|uniref:hypothetical protein n=1 Tax=Polynucleobacter rarus TaxID=556055 RepID=UPI000D3E1D30|nr:hypothetical protein [Polynucleobacter rarus]
METKYARLNLKLKNDKVTNEDLEKWQKTLYESALEGLADDVEVFYLETEKVIGVSVPYYDEGLSLLEAGMALGYCQRTIEDNYVNIFNQSWNSLHESDGTVIESTL